MSPEINTVHHVSDTARWVAYFRAMETRRPDALFRDPFAEKLAGEHGFQIANTLPDGNKHEWAWVARTYLFDHFIADLIGEGTRLIVNLAAGLDARPYRLSQLSPSVRWIEVDFPEIVSYKSELLAEAKPLCDLKRVSLDLKDMSARRSLFSDLQRENVKTAVMCEGLLIYFSAEEVASLAQDLSQQKCFSHWVIDLVSSGQLKLMQSSTGKQLSEAGAAFKFGPPDGPSFFSRYGWDATDVQGLLETAAKFNRAPAGLKPLRVGKNGVPGGFPWTGVCLLKNLNA